MIGESEDTAPVRASSNLAKNHQNGGVRGFRLLGVFLSMLLGTVAVEEPVVSASTLSSLASARIRLCELVQPSSS